METKKYNYLIVCSFCGKEIKKGNQWHIKKCREEYLKNLTEEQKQEIINDYINEGLSIVQMSKKYNLSYSQIKYILSLLGVKLRKLKEAINMPKRKEQYTQTMLKNHGTTHNFNRNCESRKKWEKRLFDEEGIVNVFQRKEVIDKIKDTMINRYGEGGIYYNRMKGNTLQYWINKLGKEKGIEKYNEICYKKGNSNRYEYYVEKYGEIECDIQWKKRLEQLSHDNFVYQVGLNKRCYKILDNNSIEYQKEFKIYKESTHRYYSFDIKIGNLLIELNGVYWHCSPKRYQPNDIVRFPGNIFMKAKDKWEYDKIKKEAAIKKGYIVETIWEDEFNEAKLLEIINKYNNGNS